jgi:SAM-dependent methyltransferase
VDVSSYAVGRARAKGFSVALGTVPGVDLPAGAYDVVTMWDLIEHVPDPSATLAACRRLLAPGGILVASTPDAGSLPAVLLRHLWLGFRCVDEHIYFFTRRTMRRMLEKAGLEARRFFAVGKHLAVPRIVTRLRFYSRIAAFALGSVDRRVPGWTLYLNPLDTMCVVASAPRA